MTFAYPEATYIAPGMFSNTIKFRVKHAEGSGICLRDILRDDFRVSGKYTYRVYSNTLRDIQIEVSGGILDAVGVKRLNLPPVAWVSF